MQGIVERKSRAKIGKIAMVEIRRTKKRRFGCNMKENMLFYC